MKVALIVLGLALQTLWAEPIVSDFFPRGAMPGETVRLYVSGIDCESVDDIIFCEPGLSFVKAEAWENEALLKTKKNKHRPQKQNPKKNKKKADSSIALEIQLSPDLSFGPKCFYLHSPNGVSLLQRFFVEPYPVCQESDIDHELGHLQEPLCIEGRLMREHSEEFKFLLDADECCSIEINGLRLNADFFDPKIMVRDPDGLEVLRVDDTNLLGVDPWCSFKAKKSGEYRLELRHASETRDNHSAYTMTIGPFTRPVSIFPLGAERNVESTFTFLGNENALGSSNFIFSKIGFTQVYPKLGDFPAPSGHQILVSDAPQALEHEPNNERPLANVAPENFHQSNINANSTQVLCWNGTLYPRGDMDWLTFKADREDTYRFEVFAERLQSPLDATLSLYNVKGKKIKSADDKNGNLDPICEHNLKANEEVWLKIEDQLDRGGLHHHYLVLISRVENIPSLSIEPFEEKNPLLQVLPIPRGGSLTLPLRLKWEDRNQEVQVVVPHLPEGWTSAPIVFPKGTDEQVLCISIDPLCNVRHAELRPQLTQGKSILSQEILSAVGEPNNTVFDSFTLDHIPAAMVDVEVPHFNPPANVVMVRGGQLQWPIPTQSTESGNILWHIKILGCPPYVSAPEDTEWKGPSGNLILALQTGLQAKSGSTTLALQAHAKVGKTTRFCGSSTFVLRIEEPYLTGELTPCTATLGENVFLGAQLKTLRPFEGKVPLELLGLPYGCKAEPQMVEFGQTTATWELSVDENAPVGQHQGLFLHTSILSDAGVLTHNFASGGSLRIDRPRKNNSVHGTTKANISPKDKSNNLSRLEQLRLKRSTP